MLAAFQMYGLQPGPLLFTQDTTLVWGLIASLYVSNTLLLVLNLPLIRIWVQLLRVPTPLLFAAVLAFATVGVYTLNNNLFDVALVYVIGLLACGMRRYRIRWRRWCWPWSSVRCSSRRSGGRWRSPAATQPSSSPDPVGGPPASGRPGRRRRRSWRGGGGRAH